MKHVLLGAGVATAALLLGVSLVGAAPNSSTIDFEGTLVKGDIVTSLSFGAGISGDDAGGFVAVEGTNPRFGAETDDAMIFDTDSISGGDTDLAAGDGNVLIITEDEDASDPDDEGFFADVTFQFDYSSWGTGTVTVNSLNFVDIEEAGGTVEVFSGGCGVTSEGVVGIPTTGDGGVVNFAVGFTGDCMVVTLAGSGAIDNISIEEGLPALARITGGGWRTTGFNGESIRSSQGLTLHCDITLSNNLQINWDQGAKWHINKLVDAAFCYDHPDYMPEPPVAPADTYVGLDVGKLNNVDGSVACFILADHGEVAGDPDGPDQALIRVWDVGFNPGITEADLADPDFDCLVVHNATAMSDQNTVLLVPLSDMNGNLQFHFDQPHGGNRP